MRILDRYILKSFLVPFLYCFFGFLAIWFVFDLSTTAPDFIAARVDPRDVLRFYATQVPQFIVISLPVGVLLALLYSMSQLSRKNEIISMLTAGVSVIRILIPLFVVGFLLSLVSMFFNHTWAPRAEALRESLRQELIHGESREDDLIAHLFVNRAEERIWFIRRLPADLSEIRDFQVITMNEQGGVAEKVYARIGVHRPEDGSWWLDWPKFVTYDEEGNVLEEYYDREAVIEGWSETPWRLASSEMVAQQLSVRDLRAYLRNNHDFTTIELAPFRTHLMDRLALPWACLVVVFIAAPLGIVYSRRGLLAGVASAIFIFFGMVFLTKLFMALGEGARIPAFLAGWGPNLIFLSIGVYLLYLRSTNRELPNPMNFLRTKT